MSEQDGNHDSDPDRFEKPEDAALGGLLSWAAGDEPTSSANDLPASGLSADGELSSSITAADSPEALGTRIGRYKLLERIGEGGMGVVFMAEQLEPVRRRVALKVIKPGMDTKQVIARFEAERQALALMDHAHIAKVLDGGATAAGRPYFVMELVRGTPITQYCDAHKLDTRQRLELFAHVCAAVQHAHAKGVIHRDIKPSNVLVVDHEDGTPVPKVIDFGIAKATGAELTERTLFTAFGQMVGTPQYMSPEQAGATAAGDVDTRSDVYSLGVLLYELLTGTTPFESSELRSKAYGEIQRIIREVEPPKPSTRLSSLAGDALSDVAASRKTEPRKLGRSVRGELDWIVMRAMEKDRARRYETANGLAADVRRFLTGEPVAAGPASATYRVRKFVRRYRLAVSTITTVAAVLVIGLGAAVYAAVRINRSNVDLRAARKGEADKAHLAEKRYAGGLVAQSDAFWQAGRWGEAKDLVDLAARTLSSLGESTLPADLRVPPMFQQVPKSLLSFQTKAAPRPCLAMTPDGKYVVTADGTAIVVWSLLTGDRTRTFTGHEKAVTCLTVSDDGRFAASGSADGLVILWDWATGKPVYRFSGHASAVRCVAASADAQLVVSGGDDGTVREWSGRTGKLLQTFTGHNGPVASVAVSSDSSLILSGGSDDVILWDAQSGTRLRALGFRSYSGRAAQAVAFSRDNTLAVASDSGGFVCDVWNVPTGSHLRRIDTSGGVGSGVAFLGSSHHIITANTAGRLAMHDADSGATIRIFEEGRNRWMGLAVSRDGAHAASVSALGVINHWSLSQPREVVQAALSPRGGPCVAFCPTAPVVVACMDPPGGGTLHLWDAASGTTLATVDTGAPDILVVDFTPDGGKIVSGHRDGTVRFWDTRTLRQLQILTAHRTAVMSIALSGDGRLMVTGACDEAAKVWSVSPNVQALVSLPGHQPGTEGVRVALDPKGEHVWSGDTDGVIRSWDAQTGKKMSESKSHEGLVTAVACLRDGKRVVSAGADFCLRLSDAVTGRVIQSFEGHQNTPWGVLASADGRLLASSGVDGRLKFWDPQTGAELAQYAFAGDVGVRVLALSTDQRYLVYMAYDGFIRCVDLTRPSIYRGFESRLPEMRRRFARDSNDSEAAYELARWYAFRGVDDFAIELFAEARRGGITVPSMDLARCYAGIGDRHAVRRAVLLAGERGEVSPVYGSLLLQKLGNDLRNPSAGAFWIGVPLPSANESAATTAVGIRPGRSESTSPAQCFFRRSFVLSRTAPSTRADLTVTAVGDRFTLYVNGQPILKGLGEASKWRVPRRVDIAPYLTGGRNVLAVTTVNGDGAGRAGMLIRLVVEPHVGRGAGTQEEEDPLVILSDAQWKASDREAQHWEKPDFQDGEWKAAREVAPARDGDWVSQFPGDGVKVKILQNDQQVWPESGGWMLLPDPTVTVAFDATTEAKAGDKFVFLVNIRDTIDYDTTHFDPTITYALDGETHTASEEFAAEQGQNGWRYQYVEGGKFVDLVHYPNHRWRLADDTPTQTPYVGAAHQHPHPGQDAARIWTAPKAGKVRITGSVTITPEPPPRKDR